MDEYARGFSQAVDNFRALIQGRVNAYEGQYRDEARLGAFRDILDEDIPKMEGLAHSLTVKGIKIDRLIDGYNKRVVELVENVMGLGRK